MDADEHGFFLALWHNLALRVTAYPTGLPLCADWKSAFLGTLCRASACADAPGRRRPTVDRRPMAGDFSRHVGSYRCALISDELYSKYSALTEVPFLGRRPLVSPRRPHLTPGGFASPLLTEGQERGGS